MRGPAIGLAMGALLLVAQQFACVPYVATSPRTVKIAVVYSFASADRAVSEESVQAARRLVGERAAMDGCRVELVITDSWEWEPGRRARSIAADQATMIVLGHGSESDLTVAGEVYGAANLPWISFSPVEGMPSANDEVRFAALASEESTDQASNSQKATPVNSDLVEAVVSVSLDAIEAACDAGQPTRDSVSGHLADLAGQMPTTFRAIAR